VPVAGGWVDTRDARGAPAGRTMPASALYHLYGAAAEARRIFGAAGVGAHR
jgi:mannose/cellobiose epimerase-like protein (N-acyl-D-glucosamine 2-epimerase family)